MSHVSHDYCMWTLGVPVILVLFYVWHTLSPLVILYKLLILMFLVSLKFFTKVSVLFLFYYLLLNLRKKARLCESRNDTFKNLRKQPISHYKTRLIIKDTNNQNTSLEISNIQRGDAIQSRSNQNWLFWLCSHVISTTH